MSLVGASIEMLRRQHELNVAKRPDRRKKVVAATEIVEVLTIVVSDTTYPVFVPGVDSEFDSTVRYIP